MLPARVEITHFYGIKKELNKMYNTGTSMRDWGIWAEPR